MWEQEIAKYNNNEKGATAARKNYYMHSVIEIDNR